MFKKRRGAFMLMEAMLSMILMAVVTTGMVGVYSESFVGLDASRTGMETQQIVDSKANEISAVSYGNLGTVAEVRAAFGTTGYDREVLVGAETTLVDGVTKQRVVTTNIYKSGEATPAFSLKSYPTDKSYPNEFVLKSGDVMTGALVQNVDGLAQRLKQVAGGVVNNLYLDFADATGVQVGYLGYSGSNNLTLRNNGSVDVVANSGSVTLNANNGVNLNVGSGSAVVNGNENTPTLTTKSPNGQLWFYNFVNNQNYIESVNGAGNASQILNIGGVGNSATTTNFAGTVNVSGAVTAPTFHGDLVGNASTASYASNAGNLVGSATASEIFNSGWYRNVGSTGLYNQSFGTHFYATDPNYWVASSDHGMRITSKDTTTTNGYLYYDASGFGLLHRDGGWAVRTTPGATELFGVAYGNGGTLISTGNIGSQSVNYATSSGNADMVDGKHAGDFAPSGYGLGTVQGYISGVDCDTLTLNGWYSGHVMPNAPDSAYWKIFVVNSADTGYITQMAFPMTSSTQGSMFLREKRAGVWGAWKQSVTTDGANFTGDVTGTRFSGTGGGGVVTNSAYGLGSLASNTTGFFNTATGYYAGGNTTTGYRDTFLGHGAGALNTTGYSNVFVGADTGYNNSTGHDNVFLGNHAGVNVTTGSNNIIIGSNVNVISATADNQLNIGNVITGDLGTKEVGFAGKVSFNGIQMNTSQGWADHAGHGQSWFSSAYDTWIDYMAPAAVGSAPNGATPSTIGSIASWARRSLVENYGGYGWIWESKANNAAGDPVAMMGLNSNNGDLFVRGSVTAPTFNSTVGTGTAPFSVASSTVVGNLNADMVDGVHGSQFLRNDVSSVVSGDNSISFGPNSTWGQYLRVGGNGNNGTTTAAIATTDGNLHIDAMPGHDTFLNYYSGSRVIFGNGTNATQSYIDSNGVFNGTATNAVNADMVDGKHSNQLFVRDNVTNNRLIASDGTNADNWNQTGSTFSYASGSPWTGPIMGFGGLGSNNYNAQFNASYLNDGGHMSFRTRQGDAGTWNSWYEMIHSGNIGEMNVKGATVLNPISGDANYKLAYTADGQRTNAGEWGRVVMRYEPNGQTYGVRTDRADYADSAGTATTATTAGYATSAGNATTADTANRATHLLINGSTWDSNWTWAGQGGQPTYLWGSNDGTNMYVWNPANFNVNYATSAGNADTVDGVHAGSFMRSDTDTGTSGSIDVTGGSGTGYSTAPIEVRTTETPRISFHWPGVVASQIGMDSAGSIRTYDNPGTGYATFKAGAIYSNDSPVITSANIGSQSVNYAANAGNADMVDGHHFNWSGQPGQPTWVWGGEDSANMYVYNPANFSVNYANFAGKLPDSSGSYGSAEVVGSKNGWSGLHFPAIAKTLMAEASGMFGIYTDAGVWEWRFDPNGILQLFGAWGHTTIGALNSDYFHFVTDLPQFYFNKAVHVAGDIYGGVSYNRRLAYVDEVPGIKVNNAVYANHTEYADDAGNAGTLALYSAGNGSGQIPVSNGVKNENLNADMVDGRHAGNDDGQIPISNGEMNLGLNADTVHGKTVEELMGDAGHSFGTDGYQKLGSGLVMQWVNIPVTYVMNNSWLDGATDSYHNSYHVYGTKNFPKSFTQILWYDTQIQGLTVTNSSITQSYYITDVSYPGITYIPVFIIGY